MRLPYSLKQGLKCCGRKNADGSNHLVDDSPGSKGQRNIERFFPYSLKPLQIFFILRSIIGSIMMPKRFLVSKESLHSSTFTLTLMKKLEKY